MLSDEAAVYGTSTYGKPYCVVRSNRPTSECLLLSVVSVVLLCLIYITNKTR